MKHNCPNCGYCFQDKTQISKDVLKILESELIGFTNPIRKGKKRGELIGFSKKKLTCAILKGVTQLSLKSIADYVGVAPSIMRFWMSQDNEFRKKVFEISKKYFN